MIFPKNFLWGGATSAAQYKVAYLEVGKLLQQSMLCHLVQKK